MRPRVFKPSRSCRGGLKICYEDRVQAEAVLARRRRTGGADNREVRAYECRLCRYWHLTSQEEKPHD